MIGISSISARSLRDPHPPLPWASGERIALVTAHPDDETIGAGGHLSELRDVVVLTITDGAPADEADWLAAGCSSRGEYAALRRAELVSSMALAGISAERLEFFNIQDQQASAGMAALALRLATWLCERGIGLVLTHPFEMGHSDHDAVALAVHAATALMDRDGKAPPRLAEFTSYHRGPNGELVTGLFAPGGDPGELRYLNTSARALKRRMLDTYRSQARVLAPFGNDVERFRLAPSYRFTVPPHGNGAYYDRFDWGMRSERWFALAADALDTLGLDSC
jgi:LmbE family N-acetylglucosaminyl deacetylase